MYYDKYIGNDTLIFYSRVNNSDNVEIETSDSIVKIAGFDCIIVKANNISTNMNTTYYFAKELKIDPSFNQNNNLVGDIRMMSEFHSIFLKKELEFGPYKATFTADSIRTQPLDKEIFALPELRRKIK